MTAGDGIGRRLSSPFGAALDLLLPHQCLKCGIVIGKEGALCGACLRDPPSFARARAVLRYDSDSRHLVLGLKHGDRTHAAPAFRAWLARAAGPLLADADLVVPVPLHRLRLFRRRYNQAALLAHAFAQAAGLPCVPDLPTRVRATPSQGRLSRTRRRINVRRTFAVDVLTLARVVRPVP